MQLYRIDKYRCPFGFYIFFDFYVGWYGRAKEVKGFFYDKVCLDGLNISPGFSNESKNLTNKLFCPHSGVYDLAHIFADIAVFFKRI